MAVPLKSGRQRAVQQLVGLLFLAVLAGLVALAIALYQKAFTDVTTVYVEADRVGNQLTKGGDVKLRGLLVGEIRGIQSNGERARVELALKPEQAERIPRDVVVQFVPKTLFGEKFASLVTDDDSRARPLREGDVISQDQSETARETSQALDDLLPLLQAMRPQDLSVTLNALSTTLRGRGNRIGESLVLTDGYLKELNPEIAALGENFGGVADFADTLDKATPDIVRLLENSSAIGRNLVDQEQQLSTFLEASASGAGELEGFLSRNEQRIIRLAADSRPSLEVYDRYSPQYPCFLKGLEKQLKVGNDTFGGLQPGLHITLEFTEDQQGYVPGDQPAYGEDAGPTCRGLPPNKPIVPFPADIEVTDGYCDEEERSAPGVQNGCRPEERGGHSSPSAAVDPARALAPRELERAAVGAVAGPVMGVAPKDVPDLALLLFGPMARGTSVSLTPRG